jgi:hypothetical protein
MKTTTVKVLALAMIATAAIFSACKKKEPAQGPAGPAGPAGANGVVPMSTDGFIKGTISGTRRDGTPFNETFDFKNYWGSPSGTLDSIANNDYQFEVSRGEDIWGNNYASVGIETTSKTATTGTINNLYITYTKSLGTNKQFVFSVYGGTTTATGVSYSPSTGVFSGAFTYVVPGMYNSTGNTATVTGSFEATITQNYNIVKSITSVPEKN